MTKQAQILTMEKVAEGLKVGSRAVDRLRTRHPQFFYKAIAGFHRPRKNGNYLAPFRCVWNLVPQEDRERFLSEVAPDG